MQKRPAGRRAVDSTFYVLRSQPDGPSGENGPDDCFCCSHVVDVRTPFRLALSSEFVKGLHHDAAGPSHLTPVPLYPPPLALTTARAPGLPTPRRNGRFALRLKP